MTAAAKLPTPEHAQVLDSLLRVPGVKGACILDHRWRVQAIQMPAPYEPILIEQACRLLEDIGHAHASVADGSLTGLTLQCAEGTLLLRRTDAHSFFLLCDGSLKTALLDVALNVATLKLANAATPSRPPPVPRPPADDDTVNTGLTSGVQPKHHAQGKPRRASVRPPKGDETTGFFTNAHSTGATSATRASAAKLIALKAVLEKYVGKKAKSLIKEEIQRLGGMSGDKIRINFDELTAVVVRRLPTGMRPQVLRDLAEVMGKPPKGS